jgi:hypothetical protein
VSLNSQCTFFPCGFYKLIYQILFTHSIVPVLGVSMIFWLNDATDSLDMYTYSTTKPYILGGGGKIQLKKTGGQTVVVEVPEEKKPLKCKPQGWLSPWEKNPWACVSRGGGRPSCCNLEYGMAVGGEAQSKTMDFECTRRSKCGDQMWWLQPWKKAVPFG